MAAIFSSPEFEALYTYNGNDLGAVWTKEQTSFRLWAPTAKSVSVNLYRSGTPGTKDLIQAVPMASAENGTWTASVSGDLNGVYYTYSVDRDGEVIEACDPYAKTTGVNGLRAMVIDLASTDPEGWDADRDPHAGIVMTDAVIGELHVRDLSIDPSANIKNAGKYLGVIESGAKTASGIPTGIDHFKTLGITHLHILPMYDYGSVDESKLDVPQFNWGYDPVNFNVPEGSYASDPFHGEVRVKEVKQMVNGLHEAGISVVMDVVYNHVYEAKDFCFNMIVPNYFSRVSEKGVFSNGSFCGNDTASERSMVHKYIVDSVCYWADEYHIDGFRFDLVGLIDTVTINDIISEVHKKHPNVIFYGEGWTMPTVVTKPGVQLTTQPNAAEVPEFAFFSDTIRDALRGSTMDTSVPGFIVGAKISKNLLHSCFMGMPTWAPNPTQSINYVSCHDNNTLFDRIALSVPEAPVDIRVRMNNLGAAFVIMAQGVPFFQAGEEMLRTKPDGKGGWVENSYASPDSVNAIKWNTLNDPTVAHTCDYYRGMLAFRKAHPSLRLTERAEVLETVTPIHLDNPYAVAFGIRNEKDVPMIAVFNAGLHSQTVTLPAGKWGVCINADKAGTEVLQVLEGTASAEGLSALVLVKLA